MSSDIPGRYRVPASARPEPAAGEPKTTIQSSVPPPRSLPPTISSLPPPVPRSGVTESEDLSRDHGWLTDPRLSLLRRSVSDARLVKIHGWGIDPIWTTNQIVSHVHVMLEKKSDRKVFEELLKKCDDKADLLELVYSTLAALPADVAARQARMRALSR